MNASILKVVELSTHFVTFGGKRVVKAVDRVSLEVKKGDTVAIIGESGSGKSTLALSIVRVLPQAARVVGGKVFFEGEDLLLKTSREMTRIRGEKISMILQDPMMSLNPVFTVGEQIAETLKYHLGYQGQQLKEKSIELLCSVKIPAAETRLTQYPHEMSGGMRQRIVGAIALSCEPSLLLADEPTTNLDVTIQRQYLDLLRSIQKRTGVTLLFITHNLGIVAEMCEFVAVMYAGRIVETAPVNDIYDNPAHPYTKALIMASFGLHNLEGQKAIRGDPPNLANLPSGCSFYPRCGLAAEVCRINEPPEMIIGPWRSVRCWRAASMS